MDVLLTALGKYVGGRVLTVGLVLTATLVIIWYYRMPIEQRDAVWNMIRGVLIWLGFVAILPWATFWIVVRTARADSNAMSAVMLVSYWLVDIVFALYLTGGSFGNNTWQTAILILGFLCAALYNFVTCEFVADRASDAW